MSITQGKVCARLASCFVQQKTTARASLWLTELYDCMRQRLKGTTNKKKNQQQKQQQQQKEMRATLAKVKGHSTDNAFSKSILVVTISD